MTFTAVAAHFDRDVFLVLMAVRCAMSFTTDYANRFQRTVRLSVAIFLAVSALHWAIALVWLFHFDTPMQ